MVQTLSEPQCRGTTFMLNEIFSGVHAQGLGKVDRAKRCVK